MMLPICVRAIRYSKRIYSQRHISNVATSSQIDVELTSLIDNLIDSGVENSKTNNKTSKRSASVRRIQAANTIDLLKQVISKFFLFCIE